MYINVFHQKKATLLWKGTHRISQSNASYPRQGVASSAAPAQAARHYEARARGFCSGELNRGVGVGGKKKETPNNE